MDGVTATISACTTSSATNGSLLRRSSSWARVIPLASDHPTGLWLQAAGQEKNAVVESALQPILVSLHQLTTLITPG